MAASWQMGRLLEAEGRPMRACTTTITFETTQSPEFVDITDRVTDLIRESGIQVGFAVVFSRHTTGAIKINELEPLLLQDMADFLERMSPRNAQYRHNDFSVRTVNMTEDECPNGHAHCQHLLLSSSETIPVVGGEPQFGQYQRLFFIELDRPRAREVLVQLLGV
jgi:secondary thiamine-phosphate synthase enzyme